MLARCICVRSAGFVRSFCRCVPRACRDKEQGKGVCTGMLFCSSMMTEDKETLSRYVVRLL